MSGYTDLPTYGGGGGSLVAGGYSGYASASASAFAQHMLRNTAEGRAEVFNAAQYGALAVAPVAMLNRALNWAVPEPNEEASSFVLLLEVAAQAAALFVGLLLTHRLVTFVPTYSGFKHEPLSLAALALAVLVIMLSVKSKFGIKVAILAERLGELWNGPGSAAGADGGKSTTTTRTIAPHGAQPKNAPAAAATGPRASKR